MKRLLIAAATVAICVACQAGIVPASTPAAAPALSPTYPVTSQPSTAQTLARTLDGMQVQTHWLKGVGVDWQTGEANFKSVPLDDTHCSAFVAAVSLKLGVDLLRPPEHKTTLLANAQNEWLNARGAEFGWERLTDGIQAQSMANQGYFVIASYRNPNPTKHGHIAVVRPSDKSISQILEEGPQIIQAGIHNFNSASVKQGFAAHPYAFSRNRIQYFAHKID